MTARISWSSYGKSSVRVVKVRRTVEPHEIIDLTIDIALEGGFEDVYTRGDNTACVATDTMKNTVYAFARVEPIDHVETFVEKLADYFSEKPRVSLVRIQAAEHPWTPIHAHAFTRAGEEEWTTSVTCDGGRMSIASGLGFSTKSRTERSSFRCTSP